MVMQIKLVVVVVVVVDIVKLENFQHYGQIRNEILLRNEHSQILCTYFHLVLNDSS